VIGEIVVRRIDGRAAGVADARANDSWMTPEPGVRCPESAKAEGCGLDVGRLLLIEWKHRAQSTSLGPSCYAELFSSPL
jgi:hypothetical protein